MVAGEDDVPKRNVGFGGSCAVDGVSLLIFVSSRTGFVALAKASADLPREEVSVSGVAPLFFSPVFLLNAVLLGAPLPPRRPPLMSVWLAFKRMLPFSSTERIADDIRERVEYIKQAEIQGEPDQDYLEEVKEDLEMLQRDLRQRKQTEMMVILMTTHYNVSRSTKVDRKTLEVGTKQVREQYGMTPVEVDGPWDALVAGLDNLLDGLATESDVHFLVENFQRLGLISAWEAMLVADLFDDTERMCRGVKKKASNDGKVETLRNLLERMEAAKNTQMMNAKAEEKNPVTEEAKAAVGAATQSKQADDKPVPKEAKKDEGAPAEKKPAEPTLEGTLEEIMKRLTGGASSNESAKGAEQSSKDSAPPPPPPPPNPRSSGSGSGGRMPPMPTGIHPLVIPVVVAGVVVTMLLSWKKTDETNHISFQDFQNRFLANGSVGKLIVSNGEMVYVYPKVNNDTNRPIASFRIGTVDHFEKALEASERMLGTREEDRVPVLYRNGSGIVDILLRLAPTLLIVSALVISGRAAMSQAGKGGMGGNSPFNIGKSNAKMFQKQNSNTSFADVAGCDEAKVEVMEFVEFLKTPARFTKLGAKVPKGALLVGPPGTGKTLLAKATAGEASVPFFSVSGSDFIEMFVGVGPARVRDLFAQARANAPCIVFIDEIDAVGRQRGKGGFRSGANDERESTLNQILVEMDGMDTKTGIVVLAGTNRPDILDSALVRAGRFDRQISIDLPDVKARKDIFMVHLKALKLELAPAEYAPRLAQLTPGFSGADIANVCNEAALIAARYGAGAVHWKQFEQAIDRVIAGLERKTRVLSPEEKKTVAYHEAGHAVSGWFLEGADPLLKVSIVPRGMGTLGFAQYLPADVNLYTKQQIEDKMCMALGGRVSEELNFGRITTGASDDLDRVTKMAYGSVVSYGMGSMGPLSYRLAREGDMTIGKPYSEDTAAQIDDEVLAMIKRCYERTKQLLIPKMKEIDTLAKLLLDKEVVNREEVELILGKRPFAEDPAHQWAGRLEKT